MFACEIKEEFDSKMEIEGEFSFYIIFTHRQRLKTLKTIPSDLFNRPTIEVPPPTPYILHYCVFLLLHPNINHPPPPTPYNLKSSQSPEWKRVCQGVAQDRRSLTCIHVYMKYRLSEFFFPW